VYVILQLMQNDLGKRFTGNVQIYKPLNLFQAFWQFNKIKQWYLSINTKYAQTLLLFDNLIQKKQC